MVAKLSVDRGISDVYIPTKNEIYKRKNQKME